MNKCPHCGKEGNTIPPAEYNFESYRKPVNALVSCCGNIVRVTGRMIFSYEIPENHDNIDKDDWGNKKKKSYPTTTQP